MSKSFIKVNRITTTILMKVMNIGILGPKVVNTILWSLSNVNLVTQIISKVCNCLTKDETQMFWIRLFLWQKSYSFFQFDWSFFYLLKSYSFVVTCFARSNNDMLCWVCKVFVMLQYVSSLKQYFTQIVHFLKHILGNNK